MIATAGETTAIDAREFDAVLLDLDGVVTDTARIHAETWKDLFDDFLREYSRKTGQPHDPFDARHDYLKHVDGKPRYDGARDFLKSRSIDLPEGDANDPPGLNSVRALGNRKNELFNERLKKSGVEVFDSTIRFIKQARACGMKTAIISSSKNCEPVLRAAGITDLFDTKVDGGDVAELGLEGKPDPAMFLRAAETLGVEPDRAIVIEDAVAGVEAGAEGRFGLVIGIDRRAPEERSGTPGASRGFGRELLEHGADVVVADMEEIEITPHADETTRSSDDLPSALEAFDEIADRLRGKDLVVFLDYDGTLTPIVEKPEDAVLTEAMRESVSRLAKRCHVAIVSGRDLPDVRKRVNIDNVFFAGSHGFDIAGPEGFKIRHEAGSEFLPSLDAVEEDLRRALDGIDGAQVERKRYSIAVHYRRVGEDDVSKVATAVDDVLSRHGSNELRKTHGKKVFDLQPAIDWHKGRAIEWLMDALKIDRAKTVPVYIGDDKTDEDAFAALNEQGGGVCIIVAAKGDARKTAAEFVLRDQKEVAEFLDGLAGG